MSALAVGVRGRPARVASRTRRRRTALRGIAAALLWQAAAGTSSPATAASAWSLLPQPTTLRPAASGSVSIAEGARVIVQGADRAAVGPIADQFIQRVASTRGLHLVRETGSGGSAAITFELDPHAAVVGDSGYRIVIDGAGIRIVARTPAGAFYGSVTAWQLLTAPGWTRGAPADVAHGTIDDHPRFAWRALMLDSGRHFQSVAEIKQLIDWMSLDKLNVLLWHVTEDQGWRIAIPNYPELTRTGACRKAAGLDDELTGSADRPYCGFYSEADVREIVAYASARFVTVVPEIDLPGHSQAAVAAYPRLGVTGERPPVWTEWGISPWLLKPDEPTLQFVNDVLDEVMRLFPSRYVSIGGDEADKQQWNASPELRARMVKLGLKNMEQLQGWFMDRVAEHLVEHGRTPVGWDDSLVAGVKLPPSQVVMSWHGSDGQRVARKAAAQGHDVVLTPTDSLYFDYYQSSLPDEWAGQPPLTTLRQVYDTPLSPTGATPAEMLRIIGVQGNLWTEFMQDFTRVQHAVYPRITALSELGWSTAGNRDWKGFLSRLPAELARYRSLGIGYADSAFAPAFSVVRGGKGTLRVALSNQAGYGEIRYTIDGSTPSATSTRYAGVLDLATAGAPTLRAATFGPGGFALAAPRAKVVSDSALLGRDSSELDSCSKRPGIRLDGRQPASGPRRFYSVYVGDMCWRWHGGPVSAGHVALRVERLAWRFGDDAKDAIARPKLSADGEFEIHAGTCTGSLLARLPLKSAAQGRGQSELNATLSPTKPGATGDLCIFATGDPRDGQWALDRVTFSN